MDSLPNPQRRPPSLVRMLRARPRLLISAAVGLALIAALSLGTGPALSTRLLFGWNLGVGLYLVLAFRMMARSDVHRIRRRAAMQDEGQLTILALTVVAALASLGAIFAELGTNQRTALQLIDATLTIALSWAFVHTMFALHYAHEFYSDDGHTGLVFPGTQEPDYWDFVYFSFVIGMTSQVSDVAVASKPIRRTVSIHGIVSFVFNAALLALTVNIAASVIQRS